MKKIKFINTTTIELLEKPYPASKNIPEWYKNISPYINGGKDHAFDYKENAPYNERKSTVKKCMPVFDAITNGYLVPLVTDIHVSQVNNVPYYQWSNLNLIDFHPIEQVVGHPDTKNIQHSLPKIMSPWAYKLPKNYSLLCIPPMHRDNVINILPGIVDVDKYNLAINFPFVLKDNNFQGIIPKGTPIAQLIPIKRENWNSEYEKENEQNKINTSYLIHSHFINGYKNYFWSKKRFK